MPEKYFTLEEAQELLDYVGPQLKVARDQRRRVEVLERELTAGASPNSGRSARNTTGWPASFRKRLKRSWRPAAW